MPGIASRYDPIARVLRQRVDGSIDEKAWTCSMKAESLEDGLLKEEGHKATFTEVVQIVKRRNVEAIVSADLTKEVNGPDTRNGHPVRFPKNYGLQILRYDPKEERVMFCQQREEPTKVVIHRNYDDARGFAEYCITKADESA